MYGKADMGVLSLRTLCENVLLKHHLSLRELGDIRYSLITRVLHKFTAQQLINLEKANPMLILEDDDVWLSLLQKDYPQDLHKRFCSNPNDVYKYYKQELQSMLGTETITVKLRDVITLEEIEDSKRYRLPYRQAYMDIQQLYAVKQEEAILNLRKNMQKMEQSKDVNRVIHLDEVIPVDSGHRPWGKRPVVSNRSPLFQKAQVEARKRRELFKNPLSLMPERQTSPQRMPRRANVNNFSTSTRVKPVVGTHSETGCGISTSNGAPINGHTTRTRTQVPSIFVPKKVTGTRPQVSPKRPMSNDRRNNVPRLNSLDHGKNSHNQCQEQDRVKRIRLSDYLKRKGPTA